MMRHLFSRTSGARSVSSTITLNVVGLEWIRVNRRKPGQRQRTSDSRGRLRSDLSAAVGIDTKPFEELYFPDIRNAVFHADYRVEQHEIYYAERLAQGEGGIPHAGHTCRGAGFADGAPSRSIPP
jgi:hypothetical protein